MSKNIRSVNRMRNLKKIFKDVRIIGSSNSLVNLSDCKISDFAYTIHCNYSSIVAYFIYFNGTNAI